MSEFPEWLQKRKIDVRGEGISEAVQKVLLSLGCMWGGFPYMPDIVQEPQYLGEHYIYISSHGWLTHSRESYKYFSDHRYVEVFPQALGQAHSKTIDNRVIV